MPRKPATSLPPIEDIPLPGTEHLGSDPRPRAAGSSRPPGRPRKAAGTAGRIATRTSTGRIMSKTQMIAKVEGELYALAMLGVGGWDMADPECAAVMYDEVTLSTSDGVARTDRTAAIVNRVVSMLARHDKALTFLAQGSLLGEAAVLTALVVPVGKRVWQAHGPNGHRHRAMEDVRDDLAERYPAPSLAG